MRLPEECFTEFISTGHIPHALLLSGPSGNEKKEVAYRFARKLVQTEKPIDQHPDIHLYFPEGKAGLHPLESLRKLMQDVVLVPYQARWKIFIIHEAEKMLPSSSNSLLKTLEEPPERTVIILLSEHAERILPTLVSRCYTLFFPYSQKATLVPELLTLLSKGWDPQTAKALENENPDPIFNHIMCWFRDRLVLEMGGTEDQLNFPEALDHIKNTPLIPLEYVEKKIRMVRLAYERSTKLSLCLEMFFLSCSI